MGEKVGRRKVIVGDTLRDCDRHAQELGLRLGEAILVPFGETHMLRGLRDVEVIDIRDQTLAYDQFLGALWELKRERR